MEMLFVLSDVLYALLGRCYLEGWGNLDTKACIAHCCLLVGIEPWLGVYKLVCRQGNTGYHWSKEALVCGFKYLQYCMYSLKLLWFNPTATYVVTAP